MTGIFGGSIVPDGELPGFDPEGAMRRQVRKAVLLVGGLCAALVAAGALVPIGGAVIAPGELAVESRIKTVAHPVGGIVSHIEVREGQHVRKG